jgi:hypothetical protein
MQSTKNLIYKLICNCIGSFDSIHIHTDVIKQQLDPQILGDQAR